MLMAFLSIGYLLGSKIPQAPTMEIGVYLFSAFNGPEDQDGADAAGNRKSGCPD